MNKIFGIAYNNRLVSNRMNTLLENNVEDGVYCLDMDVDDFMSTLEIANIDEARNFFKKSSKVEIIQGVAYKNGIIPKNPVKYNQLPVTVINPIFEDFDEVEIVKIKGKYFYFQTLMTQNSYMLMDLKSAIDEMIEKKEIQKDVLKNIQGVSPEAKMTYSFIFMNLVQEIEKNKTKEPEEYFKYVFEKCNSVVESVKEKNTGYEVIWECMGFRINSMFSKDYKVLEAGFCVSGEDRKHSISSLANLLQDYNNEGSHIYKTRR